MLSCLFRHLQMHYKNKVYKLEYENVTVTARILHT